jgi:hypothetical protein
VSPHPFRKMPSPVSSKTDDPVAALFDEIPDPAAPASPVPPVRLPSLAGTPTRRVVQGRRVAALVGGLSWLGAHLAVYGIRTDLAELPSLYSAVQIGLPVLLGTGSLVLALGAGRVGLGLKIGLVSTLAILGPASFCVLAFGAPSPRVPEPGTLIDTLLCFDITVAWVAVPLLCAALTLRGAFAAGARWRSALVGAGIGLFAGATMNLHCPNVAPEHMLLGHGLAVVAAAVLGALALVLRARA